MPRSNFSQQAKLYDSQASVQEKHAIALVKSVAKYLPDKKLKIADLGCGTGAIGKQIQESFQEFELVNCDISKNMLEIAKEKLGLANTCYSNTPLPHGSSYDLIISNFALQWYDNLAETFKSCIKKLSPGGILAISLPIEGSFNKLKETFKFMNAEEFLFQFPSSKEVKEPLRDCTILLEEETEEGLHFQNSVQLFKSLHTIGANQTDKRLATSKFRKLIRYHDELSNGKIIVSYKILKMIVKRVNP